MSGCPTRVNWAVLASTFNCDVEGVPDDLKCVECRSILRGAYQVVPCGCRFCQGCVDNVMLGGAQFCPGGSQQCGASPLLTAHQDVRADWRIARLLARCRHAGCLHECPLADMAAHLQACPSRVRKSASPESGDELGGRQRGGDLLIGSAGNATGDMEMLRRELLLRGEQVRAMMDGMRRVQDENRAIRDQIEGLREENRAIRRDNESIRREKEAVKGRIDALQGLSRALSYRLGRLSDRLQPRLDETLASVALRAGPIRASPGASGNEGGPIADDIQSLMEADSDSMRWGPGQADASCSEWVIEAGAADWNRGYLSGILRSFSTPLTSASFTGSALPYTYQLVSRRGVRWNALRVRLRILGGPRDSLLSWPFRGAVTVTVSQRDKREVCSTQMRQCQIERPLENQYRESDVFEFQQIALIAAGLDLSSGVCVSCQIVPAGTSAPSGTTASMTSSPSVTPH